MTSVSLIVFVYSMVCKILSQVQTEREEFATWPRCFDGSQTVAVGIQQWGLSVI